MKVILYQPQIPQNAGNIVRTCAVTGCSLLMVHPLGFSTQDRWLKRAGLDYWEGVELDFLDNLEEYLEQVPADFIFFSSKARRYHTEITYTPSSVLIFGSETAGLPEHFHQRWEDKFVKIPMRPEARCLNLAVSVGIGVYEAWRQQHFSV